MLQYKKRHKGDFIMNNFFYNNCANSSGECDSRRTAAARRTKGCLAPAPGGEKLVAAVSVIGWLTFIIKFAVV
jgi:hypothetical protein